VKTKYSLQAGILLVLLILCTSTELIHAEQDHSSHKMSVSKHGIVMNNNHHTLPWGCQKISEDILFEVVAGREYARSVPGMVFGMSQYEYHVKTCSRITVKFMNKDSVRHQWMVHGLPKKLYPAGMFHLEAMAGQSVEGTFIVPDANKTYLVHCDMSQHMEKGMKGQLIVGSGSGDLWGISGVSDNFRRSHYLPEFSAYIALTVLVSGCLIGVYLLRRN
jgi:plastocyanin